MVSRFRTKRASPTSGGVALVTFRWPWSEGAMRSWLTYRFDTIQMAT